MAELDNKRMWAALYRGCNNNFIQKAILNELDAQGFKIDIYGEIVPIEPEQDNCEQCKFDKDSCYPYYPDCPYRKELHSHSESNELTDVEQVLVSLIRRTEKTILTPEGLAKEFTSKLMKAARKQIASEIDVDALEESWGGSSMVLSCSEYFKIGAREVIKAIEKGDEV